METDPRLTASETRAPWAMRVQRSRPKLSVPSTCSPDGPAKRFDISIASGL